MNGQRLKLYHGGNIERLTAILWGVIRQASDVKEALIEAKLHGESIMIQRCFDHNKDDNKR